MSDTEIPLEPCPFCGGTAEIIEAEEAGPQAYVVQCTTPNCAASSKVIFALKEDVTELLVETWNRRSSRPAAVEGWRDIASAPKDGTAVRTGRISRMSVGGIPLYPITSRFIDGMWQSAVGDNRWAPYNPQPTHWQPLPAAFFPEEQR